VISRVKALFLDVDGTLTLGRNTYKLSIRAMRALRRAVSKGIVVSLVSSNALPIVVGLSKYIGLNGPVIGESGCLAYHGDWGVVPLARRSAREVYLAVLKEYGKYVEDSWQNAFRLYDYALKLRKEYLSSAGKVLSVLREFVERRYPDYTVDYSGYALHVRPVEASKKSAVIYVLGKLGIAPEEAAGIGDSVMDLGFLGVLGLSAAVANADEELKKGVSLILSKPSGLGVAEFVERVLGV